MKNFYYCLKKDHLEFVRTKKSTLFSVILLIIATMLLLMTESFPFLIEILNKKSPDFISNTTAINQMLTKLFPQDLKANLGILASNIGVFYSITVVLIVYGMVPSEIRSGKWIFPTAVGYKNSFLVFSKSLIYSFGAALPAFVMYNLYYLVASLFLINNYQMTNVFFNSLVLSISVFSITNITILSSLLYKHSIMNAMSMIVIIIAAPDILTFFSFGKYLPTYLLTYVYSSQTIYTEIIIPLIGLVIIQIFLGRIAVKKSYKIEISP